MIISAKLDGEFSVRITLTSGAVLAVPKDPANTDYAEYLEWLAEGNEPLPADEPIADAG